MAKQPQRKNIRKKRKLQKKLVKNLRELCKLYGVKLELHQGQELCNGGAIPLDNLIEMNVRCLRTTKATEELVYSILFHEIAHCLNLRNKKYVAFHSIPARGFHNLTRKHLRSIINTALKAERYTDKVGKELMAKHCPDLEYQGFYGGAYGEWLIHTFWLPPYKNRLKELDAKRRS